MSVFDEIRNAKVGTIIVKILAKLKNALESPFARRMETYGVEKAKFRDTVVPNCRMYIAMVPIEIRARRIICATQGMVNKRMVFEAEICGMAF